MPDEDGVYLLRESHVEWHRTAEGKIVAGKLDGKSLFEWRSGYNELATKFVEFADHNTTCVSRGHEHYTPVDDRIVCDAAPCTCGLLFVLSAINPTIEYVTACPDGAATNVRVLKTE